jgi:hypothetical protein
VKRNKRSEAKETKRNMRKPIHFKAKLRENSLYYESKEKKKEAKKNKEAKKAK